MILAPTVLLTRWPVRYTDEYVRPRKCCTALHLEGPARHIYASYVVKLKR